MFDRRVPSPDSKRPKRSQSRSRTESLSTHDVEKILSRRNDDDCGLEIRNDPNKGRAVFTTAPITKGMAVLEYAGDLLPGDVANAKEEEYSETTPGGPGYMFFFKADGKNWCVDATKETDRKGRIVNHSKHHYNLIPKVHMFQGLPHIVFFC